MKISRFRAGDWSEWRELAMGYKEFYQTPTSDKEYEIAWARLLEGTEVLGLGAKVEGKLVGIAHFLFHTTIWSPRTCYLQDLFTAQESRGLGVARELINAVADQAKLSGADRYYWNTQEENETARILYDKVAKYRGFIRYDFPLE
ncbi:GNAT family N-acetyltransferase [SAR92 clade bacterium H231]|nr:GNAT family N-acetyltransferase [SAR92 clade bacterium H231]